MENNAIIATTDASFETEVLQSDRLVLVDFWAAWCGPCRAMVPLVEQLANEYRDRVKVVKLDVDTNDVVSTKYKVTGIPTLLVFKDGQVVEQLVGYRSKEDIAQALDKHLTPQ